MDIQGFVDFETQGLRDYEIQIFMNLGIQGFWDFEIQGLRDLDIERFRD